MSGQIPPAIEAEAEALADGTKLDVAEAVVVLCDRDGLENEGIRAHLGATKTTGEVALDDIGRILGLSNSSVEDIRANIRRMKRELEAERDEIDRTLDVLKRY